MSNINSPSRFSLILASTALMFSLVALPGEVRAGQGDCGQPVSTGSAPTAADCVFVLKAAIGNGVCAMCVCDIDNNGSKSTADALRCLKKAVGQNIPLACPSCSGPTTTTTTIKAPPESSTSTTSTSTTSTTTTIPVKCSSLSDCSALPAGYRCNPNTDTCEKPCTRNTDCKDFYECNKTTKYCQSPSLLF